MIRKDLIRHQSETICAPSSCPVSFVRIGINSHSIDYLSGMVAAGCLLLLVSHVENAVMAIVVLGLASFANDLAIANGWGACMDVGGRSAGSLSGSMNMMGNIGGAAGPAVVGYILDRGRPSADALPTLASWSTTFAVAAAMYGVAAIAWIFIDPVTPLDSAEQL